jgi:hypothetical protein
MIFGQIDDKMSRRECLRLQFSRLQYENPLLYRILFEAEGYALHQWTKGLAVTSILRPENPSSVHAHWRGVDVGLRSSAMTTEEMTDLARWINRFWQYDKTSRHVALFGDLDPRGRHWDHLHLQTSPKTKPRA